MNGEMDRVVDKPLVPVNVWALSHEEIAAIARVVDSEATVEDRARWTETAAVPTDLVAAMQITQIAEMIDTMAGAEPAVVSELTTAITRFRAHVPDVVTVEPAQHTPLMHSLAAVEQARQDDRRTADARAAMSELMATLFTLYKRVTLHET